MDVKSIISAAPLVKKAWKFTPAPLRVPLLVIGAAVVAWRFATGRAQSDATQDSRPDQS